MTTYSAEPYNEAYYAFAFGSDYSPNNPLWRDFFGNIADKIIAQEHPVRTLDAGCALGILVGELRARGVEAYGFDFSDYAISQAAPEIKEYVYVHSIVDEIEGHYDFISCIEVLEHLPAELAEKAIANLCRHSDVILFSSCPDDFAEPTHINVRDGGYWANLFAAQGFIRDFSDTIAQNVAPQTILFRRGTLNANELVEAYEDEITRRIIRHKEELRVAHERGASASQPAKRGFTRPFRRNA